MRFRLLSTFLVLALPMFAPAQVPVSDQLPAGFLATTTPRLHRFADAGGSGHLGKGTSAGVLGLDSVVNWGGFFYDPGVDSYGTAQSYVAVHNGRTVAAIEASGRRRG